jgi:hypothetical protein
VQALVQIPISNAAIPTFPFPFPSRASCRIASWECARPSGIPAATVGTCIASRLSALSAGRASASGANQNPFWPNTKKSSELVKYAIATECKASSRILSDRCREVLVDCFTSHQSGIKPVTRVRSPLRAGGRKKIQMPRSLTRKK